MSRVKDAGKKRGEEGRHYLGIITTFDGGAPFLHSHEEHRAEKNILVRKKVVLEDCYRGAKPGKEDHNPSSRCKTFNPG